MKYFIIFFALFSAQLASAQLPDIISFNPWGLESQSGIVSIDFADFNQDDTLDMVVARLHNGSLQLLIKYQSASVESLGTIFQSADETFTYTQIKNPAYIAAEDYDLDGDTDILVISRGGYSPNSLCRMLTNSSATSPNFTNTSISSIDAPFSIGYPSPININGDSLIDLAISNPMGKVDWYLNTGNMSFTKEPTPMSIDTLSSSLSSFTQGDIQNRDEQVLISFSLERGFNMHDAQSYARDTAEISTFIDPGVGTNYFYEMHLHDFDGNGNEDIFLAAYSSELAQSYVTKFYLIQDVQECLEVLYLTSAHLPLRGVYKAGKSITTLDPLQIEVLDDVTFSAPDVLVDNVFDVPVNAEFEIDMEGCVSRK